jgi:prepilin peptidase CpaA
MADLFTYEHGLVHFGPLIFEPRTGLLLSLLSVAVMFDVRSHRIPNWLVVIGLVVGIGYHGLMPQGAGVGYALQGAGIGLGLFLPLYLLRAMGAGDVKLMGMVGAFLGPSSVLAAILATLIVGGILAIGVALWKGVLGRTFANIRFILMHAAVTASSGTPPTLEASCVSSGKLPYAVAIAGGTFLHVVLEHRGYVLVF